MACRRIGTRNDVLGNLAVLLAALGVSGTGAGWPDLAAATIMASLALQAAFTVIRQAVSSCKVQSAISRFPPNRKYHAVS